MLCVPQPTFDLHDFFAVVKAQIPTVITAYLQGDLAKLRSCAIAPEMLEARTRTHYKRT